MELLQQIKEKAIVAVIRGAKPENILPIAKALSGGGVKTLEITVETPKVLTLIEEVSSTLGDDVIVGAGTVLDSETARAAIMAGAKFIFSPIVDQEMIKLTKRYGVISIPGALTPTEILRAYESGADIVKVFPANAFGPDYLNAVHGPLPHIPLMPTGGIDVDNVADYINAGAVAAGVGSTLVNTKGIIDENTLTSITEKSFKFIEEVKKARLK
ncbi:2-dehydro-3-deoxyphosphogluconate aldolase [Anaerobacillus arseniciselenatis]|uniref:2-dehydro-3-deoxyphosphogluconate aldolase n=1 Tax=Anaerobacillus arseniciselenatis TaxID=85682 RepID=A0A1S2L6S2_9BACI|nr:bifunctional 4-hydroxy-2-oxoglutarate aldolase/2-dehydro-3-deoxy-phosphogluconate aldolase [Anaerobacillus arseniciselenatis]OIJ08199.1 2-dehydro-3-deoxyphosphogluconate aldolase [Anaerobacillus arseniciselenatis]